MNKEMTGDEVISRGAHRQAIKTGLPDELIITSHDVGCCAFQDALFCSMLLEALDRGGVPTPYIEFSDRGGVRVFVAKKLGQVEISVEMGGLVGDGLLVISKNCLESEFDSEIDNLAKSVFASLRGFFKTKGLTLVVAKFSLGVGQTVLSDGERLLVFGLIGPEDIVILDDSSREVKNPQFLF